MNSKNIFCCYISIRISQGDYLVDCICFSSFVIQIFFEVKSALLITLPFLLENELLVFLHRLKILSITYSVLLLMNALCRLFSIYTLLLKTEILYTQTFFFHGTLFALSHLFFKVLLVPLPSFKKLFSFLSSGVSQLLCAMLFEGQPLDSVLEHFSFLYAVL